MNARRELRAIPHLKTQRTILRLGEESEAPEFLRYFTENREHLEPWDPSRPAEYYTEEFWRRQLRVNWDDLRAERAVRLAIFLAKEPRQMIGTVSLTIIQRNPAHTCNLGYGIAVDQQGNGLMTEALRAVIEYAFEDLRLHRLAANYVPTNSRSGAVLRRLGFTVEGYARDYLLINGRWQDHILTSLTNPDWSLA